MSALVEGGEPRLVDGGGDGGPDRRGALAKPGDGAGQLLGRVVQRRVGAQAAQLVGDGEQGRQVSRELDVQLLLAAAVREVGDVREGVRRRGADRFVHGDGLQLLA
ncbi:hypothetical protein ACFQVA_13470 [Actinomadura keratinilytica]